MCAVYHSIVNTVIRQRGTTIMSSKVWRMRTMIDKLENLILFSMLLGKNRTEGLDEKFFHCIGSELIRGSLVFQYVPPCELKQLLLKIAYSAL